MKIKVIVDKDVAQIELVEIEGDDILDCLQKLHEKLNDVAMPRLKVPDVSIPTVFGPAPVWSPPFKNEIYCGDTNTFPHALSC